MNTAGTVQLGLGDFSYYPGQPWVEVIEAASTLNQELHKVLQFIITVQLPLEDRIWLPVASCLTNGGYDKNCTSS